MLNSLKAFVYGLISGISEILPVSSSAHQSIFRSIFGDNEHFDLYNVFLHIGILLALLYSCKPILKRFYNTDTQRSRRSPAANDRRIVKDATPVFIIISIALMIFAPKEFNLLGISALLILNGIVLFVPSRIALGNKDARSMAAIDSILIGFLGAFSIFPGLSRTAIMTTTASARGADHRNGITWAIALSVPALVILIIADIYHAILNGSSFYFSQFLNYLLSFAGGFCGGCLSVRGLRKLAKSANLSSLSYYVWGMAMLTFILYLMI